MESCESKESDMVRFGKDQKNLKTSIISLYTSHRSRKEFDMIILNGT